MLANIGVNRERRNRETQSHGERQDDANGIGIKAEKKEKAVRKVNLPIVPLLLPRGAQVRPVRRAR